MNFKGIRGAGAESILVLYDPQRADPGECACDQNHDYEGISAAGVDRKEVASRCWTHT